MLAGAHVPSSVHALPTECLDVPLHLHLSWGSLLGVWVKLKGRRSLQWSPSGKCDCESSQRGLGRPSHLCSRPPVWRGDNRPRGGGFPAGARLRGGGLGSACEAMWWVGWGAYILTVTENKPDPAGRQKCRSALHPSSPSSELSSLRAVLWQNVAADRAPQRPPLVWEHLGEHGAQQVNTDWGSKPC